MAPEHEEALVARAFVAFGRAAVFGGPYGEIACRVRRRRGDAPAGPFGGVAAPVEQILVRVSEIEDPRGGAFDLDGAIWQVQGDPRREQRHQLVWTCDVVRT